MAGQVAAVHRRHVGRRQHLRRAGVVPVVEVAPVARQRAHAGQRGFQPVRGLHGAGPAEVARGHGRQQVQPHVGGRGAACHHGLGVFLEVVGRQVVLGRRDEGLEKAPSTPRNAPQRQRVVQRRCALRCRHRAAARAPGQCRRRQPQGQQRQHQGPRCRCEDGSSSSQHRGQQQATGHQPVKARRPRARFGGRLRGGFPLQHLPMRGIQPDQRAHDGIHRAPGMVGQQRDGGHGLQHRHAKIGRQQAQVAGHADAGAAGPQLGHPRQKCRHAQGRQHQQHAPGRLRPGQRAAQQQGQQASRGQQRAAQVVQHLPAAQRGQRGTLVAPAQHPRQQLPVAARPAVLALHGHVVAGRKVLHHLHVRSQAGARQHALEQVVAEQRVLGHAPGQRGFEGVHVVDALAGVRALAKQVLVHVRHRGRIRVHAARA